mgnify:CR=1 FL=1
MNTVTAIILARNEEQHIAECIKSVQFADEILVIDDGSTDCTVSLATDLGATVICHSLNGDWSQQRRFGISQAHGNWILFIDSDERVSPELAADIRKAVQGELRAYWLRRFNLFHHNKATHGVVRPDKVLRLMPRDGATVEGAVHETFISPYPQSILSGKLYHYTYDNWHQFFDKFNKYTTSAANKYKEQGKSCNFLGDIIVRPMWAFFKIYILQRGILDGKIGFLLSVYHMMYTMTKYVKLYYLNKFNGQL